MLQNKRLFKIILVVVLFMVAVSVVLIATKKATISYSNITPESAQLRSVPPQAGIDSEYTSVISNLPIELNYTQTRNLQDTVGYLANPTQKGIVHMASYREGSRKTENDGRVSFLVDVPEAKKTFIVYDNEIVDCAPQSRQLESSWRCALPTGEDFE